MENNLKTFKRYYKDVSANSSDTDEFVPPTGTYFISEIGADGAGADTCVKIVWDYGGTEEILLASTGDVDQKTSIELTADGVKKLAIKLINDSNAPVAIGGFWTGED